MSRASGKYGKPRVPTADNLTEGEKQEFAIDDRAIPGGSTHLVNYPTVQQKVPVAEPLAEFRGMMAHGVPPETAETGHYDRETPGKAKAARPRYDKPSAPITPVPVYVVEQGQGSRPLRTVATDSFTVPAAGTEPIRIAGRDKDRSHIYLMVETAAGSAGAAPTGIRFDHEVANLDTGKGALLRAGAVGYLKLGCEDEMFAVSNDTSAVVLSVIYEFGIPGAGP